MCLSYTTGVCSAGSLDSKQSGMSGINAVLHDLGWKKLPPADLVKLEGRSSVVYLYGDFRRLYPDVDKKLSDYLIHDSVMLKKKGWLSSRFLYIRM